jgi:hypothetical protein
MVSDELEILPMKSYLLVVLLATVLSGHAVAEPAALLQLPSFDALTEKASESVNITLDSQLLGMAARFLDGKNPEDAAVKEVVSGIKGIYVRSFTFDEDFIYPRAEIDRVRKQLSGPGWQRLVEVRSRKEQADVDIYMSVFQGKVNGLALIASEPREFTIVNIVGAVDLEKLRQLEGRFGIPRLELQK